MYRLNVAALISHRNKFLACIRSDFGGWQCAQGGIEQQDISVRAALLRELNEELSIKEKDINFKYEAKYWRRYTFPPEIKKNKLANFGQTQLWFWIELKNRNCINLEHSSHEFKEVEWVNLHDLINNYIAWKKEPLLDFCKESGFYKRT